MKRAVPIAVLNRTQILARIRDHVEKELPAGTVPLVVHASGSTALGSLQSQATELRLQGGSLALAQASHGASLPRECVSALVAGMVAGADSIDDMALLRHGAMGLLWGFLPCGLVYSVLLMAASTAQPVLAAGAMLAFGVLLAAVLDEYFAFKADKRMQRSDWARRPLSDEQLQYARFDTHFFIVAAPAGQVAQHDGSLLRLRKTAADYDPRDRIGGRDDDAPRDADGCVGRADRPRQPRSLPADGRRRRHQGPRQGRYPAGNPRGAGLR